MSIQFSVGQLQKKFSGATGTMVFARLGEALRTQGRVEEAIKVCQDGLLVHPLQLSGYLVLGKAFMDAGRLDEARDQFEGALRLDSRCLAAMLFMADLMNRIQQGGAAAGYYRSILEVEPWDMEIRALLGKVSFAPPNAASPSPYAPPEDTFHKPEGMAGDVMEVDFGEANQVADFLPAQGAETLILPTEDDLSLEDGLSMQSPVNSDVTSDFQPEPVTRGMPAMIDTGETAVQPGAVLAPEAQVREKSPESSGEQVMGADIEKRLDDIFSLTGEDATPSADMAATTSVEIEPEPIHFETAAQASVASAPPVDLASDSGEEPRITGQDIESSLDKLFDMEGQSDTLVSDQKSSSSLPQPTPFEAGSEDDFNRTVTMPIMKDPGFKEGVADWVANQSESDNISEALDPRLAGAADTLMMPMEDIDDLPESDQMPDVDATLEMPAVNVEKLSETTSMELVDGTDVAERLDALFVEEPIPSNPVATTIPVAKPIVEEIVENPDSETMVTGEEVASRLSEIFEDDTGIAKNTGKSVIGAKVVTPMHDEDDYPEDEEMPPQGDGTPNVATVTLAEIYFQQGLREQALQIYRQLLDREPGNDSVRKRITEIEASIPDDENRGSDTDLRRPRPGLKVPKRKK